MSQNRQQSTLLMQITTLPSYKQRRAATKHIDRNVKWAQQKKKEDNILANNTANYINENLG